MCRMLLLNGEGGVFFDKTIWLGLFFWGGGLMASDCFLGVDRTKDYLKLWSLLNLPILVKP